ncbi:MAG: formylglycine-generating enzyme family protein [Candidatus Binatia bacterium]
MVYITPGEFAMGSGPDDPTVYEWERSHEQPQHPVFVGPYFIDAHEVTNREFEQQFPAKIRNLVASPCDECPVTNVSWVAAQAYCAARKKRLPTEAEWEKAAKGGLPDWKPTPFDEYVWFDGNTITRAQPVATKRPNPYGLYDMLGNVREWTADWYGPDYYRHRMHDEPKGPPDGQRRVERGGAFFLPARGVTTTIRYNHPPHFELYFLGFRCAQDP